MTPRAGEAELARQLATLAFARVRPTVPGAALAAVMWRNGLARLGVTPPLFVIHDLGLLLSREDERVGLLRARAGAGPGTVSSRIPMTPGAPNRPAARGAELPPALFRYEALLRAIASSDVAAGLKDTFLRDEVIVVLLARMLADPDRRWAARAGGERGELGNHGRAETLSGDLPLASPLYGADITALMQESGAAAWALSFLPFLLDQEAALLTRLERIDLGPVRLLGLFRPTFLPEDLLGLHQLLDGAVVGDAASFSFQLVSSLLESKRQGGAQMFAIDGYSSVERRGALGDLWPSELAHDAEAFELRAISDELLYFGHERPREGLRRTHGIMVDASASMRGAREVFARGLALALAKRLSLEGVETWVRFFDSRLHRKVDVAALGGRDLPYLLSFRSERGRNYARVFKDLLAEIESNDARTKSLDVTFITHAECHIPGPTVEGLAARAGLYGVFLLPARPLDLDYLPLLRGHQVVLPATLAEPGRKRARALAIVGEVLARTGTRKL